MVLDWLEALVRMMGRGDTMLSNKRKQDLEDLFFLDDTPPDHLDEEELDYSVQAQPNLWRIEDNGFRLAGRVFCRIASENPVRPG